MGLDTGYAAMGLRFCSDGEPGESTPGLCVADFRDALIQSAGAGPSAGRPPIESARILIHDFDVRVHHLFF